MNIEVGRNFLLDMNILSYLRIRKYDGEMATLAFKQQCIVSVMNVLGTGKEIELGALNADLEEGCDRCPRSPPNQHPHID
ncbi:hypothetical protein P0R31_05530 [Bradyrhizobium yuanmingense]|uniref:hypothetical protein n=1 Tax=Bradyrhizobium yuanmingense TaxID=108015 RepID=UPI0023B8A403|nr:hypothetical protein [Bradyrhizobium yuanmingense]MDF0516696.1 hypothetical protein [Bradyrhizobium yuanmingense]